MQPDGKIVVAGYCQEGTRYDFCIARFTVGGRLDSSFGSGGKVATDVTANNDFAYALALQPDGKIVVVGQCGSSTFGNFCVVRYHPHGSLDSSFSGNGIQATEIRGGGIVGGLANDPTPEFFYAEEYHQQYLAKNPDGYCGLAGTGASCPLPTGVAAE
jgi:uncharacterized delta-60 repeat protein